MALCVATAASDEGRSFPLGAAVLGDAVNFSVFSREASRVDLLLFDDPAAEDGSAQREASTLVRRSRRHTESHGRPL